MPDKNQSIESFARQLCEEKTKSGDYGNSWKKRKNLCASRPYFVKYEY